jgi:hypothetical protein
MRNSKVAAAWLMGRQTEPGGLLRRKCACGQHSTGGECEECRRKKRGTLQRSAPGSARLGEAPPIVHEVLRSPGQPLDPAARQALEPRFGHDFSQVRVHTDRRAAQSARAVDALAYTVGREIVFAGGRYQPHQGEGLKLLSHELAHVVQQDGRDSSGPLRIGPAGDSLEQEADRAESGVGVARGNGATSLLQRKITLVNTDANMPGDPDAPAEETKDKPKVSTTEGVQGWLDKLCPSGGWKVDGQGVINSPRRDTFCAETRSPGQAHFRSSGTPTSCQCLCELTAEGSDDVRVHVTDALQVEGTTYLASNHGEGTTIPPQNSGGFDVLVSGLEYTKHEGSGDSSPLKGKNQPKQEIRSPAWLIFAHEVCGHAWLGRGQDRIIEHALTPQGDRTSVDIENRIRREHSRRTGDNLGLRRGVIDYNLDPDPARRKWRGSVYEVAEDETLSKIAERLGMTEEQIPTFVRRKTGETVTAGEEVHPGELLAILGLHWHEVIEGETVERVARMWGRTPAAVLRANPQITNPQHIEVGWRLLIPPNISPPKGR